MLALKHYLVLVEMRGNAEAETYRETTYGHNEASSAFFFFLNRKYSSPPK